MSKENIKMTGMSDKFIEKLVEKNIEANKVLSMNAALEYASTGSALTDFNARATEFRNADEEVIMIAAIKAYAENPVDFVKLMFQTGDIRGGKGERRTFNTCMDWLAAVHPLVAVEVLNLIPEYTRWDYLVRQTVADNKMVSECATKIVIEQFMQDLNAVKMAEPEANVDISLLAKWMPSLQTKKGADKKVVRHLLRSFHMQEREYRKALSKLRGHLNVVEKAMSSKDYDAIDMEKLTSKQQLRYASFFQRVMAEKRHAYIQAVLQGKKKMNVSVLNPLEIMYQYAGPCYHYLPVSYNEDYEALWSLLPDKTSGNGNTLVIRDGSWSMTMPINQGSNATMHEAATAMAIYCAEHLNGAFHNKFITFSSSPQIVDLSGCHTLADKINLLYTYCDCSNTDLEATFDLILDVAISGGLEQEELPSYLMILSDMEFDEARGAEYDACKERETLFQTIRKKWKNAGYEVPTLVFWQLNGERTIYPEIDSENGVIMISGFSTNELELVMAGKYEEVAEVETVVEVETETGEKVLEVVTEERMGILSLKEQLELKLANPRYDAVEVAVKRGLAKEMPSAIEKGVS